MRVECKGCGSLLVDDEGNKNYIIFFESDVLGEVEPVKIVCIWCGHEIDYKRWMEVVGNE